MMFKRLEEMEKRYAEVENLLAQPEAAADVARYRGLLKELAHLRPAVKAYRYLKELREEISQVQDLLKDDRGSGKELLVLAQEELVHLRSEEETCLERLKEILLETEMGESEQANVIVEIRAGTGGEEAALFATDLYRMYTKYAGRQNWRTETLSAHPASGGGYKEIIFSVHGEGVYSRLKFESGTHRVQRIPVTEAGGRIHTSAATVAVLPEAEEVEVKIGPEDLKIDVYRSGGHGGQSVNTTDSAVRITHLPTGMVVTCQDERSQLKNRIKAMRVLRARLLDQIKREQQERISRDRRRQVGSGDRSEKIRTYNFPDRRVTDHRIGLVLHRLDQILNGDLDELVSALKEAERKLRLEGREGELGRKQTEPA